VALAHVFDKFGAIRLSLHRMHAIPYVGKLLVEMTTIIDLPFAFFLSSKR
jgi:hypothetical protein